jgi:hypothetical protein
VSPTGALDWMVYDYTEALGDIIRTIPSPVPPTNNALVGSAYAEGYLYLFENIYPQTASPKFYKINPANGQIITQVTLPFTGYVIGACYDGTGIWLVKWYTSNVIYKISLTGTVLSQFVPSTGSYSCRAIMYDAGYLWVGADASANNTKLYKMTTTGTILEEYTTGSVVGWYMDGEVDTQAGSGTNLFVVDNVGNTIKRLSVSGGSVSVLASCASPAVSPDVAEGLAFDGEYFWHDGAFASQGVLWLIDDGISGVPLNVTIDLDAVLPIVIPAGGGSFNYTVTIHNNESTTASFNAWTTATLPDSSTYGPILLRLLNLAAGGTITRNMTQFVPAVAPSGNYSFNAYVGTYPGQIWDSDSFPFSKSAIEGSGPYVGNWECFGWEGDYGNAGVVLPSEYSLSQNTPNPFNPETQISFALPVAGKVSLRVFNAMGEEVAVLADGYLSAGVHNYSFRANNLSSGIYFYALTAGDFHAIKKMMLLK